MDLNYLLRESSVDPETTLVLRHRPKEPELNRILPWLAAAQPDVFNAYQQFQNPRVENQMRKCTHVASFIGYQGGRAVFVGICEQRGFRQTSWADRKKIAAHTELATHGFVDQRQEQLWFDLVLTPILSEWSGKLIIRWTPPELSWSRWAAKNTFNVLAILEESILTPRMPDWRELVLTWKELHAIPESWRTALAAWRGVYFILDVSDGMGYVGSAYGDQNIRGRWENYAKSGHGGNKRLRSRRPENLRFSILERVSPDTPAEAVIQLESTWKNRLHTREHGLNDN